MLLLYLSKYVFFFVSSETLFKHRLECIEGSSYWESIFHEILKIGDFEIESIFSVENLENGLNSKFKPRFSTENIDSILKIRFLIATT